MHERVNWIVIMISVSKTKKQCNKWIFCILNVFWTSYVHSIVVRCVIWYHLYSLKNVKNTHGEVLIFVTLQAEAPNRSTHHNLYPASRRFTILWWFQGPDSWRPKGITRIEWKPFNNERLTISEKERWVPIGKALVIWLQFYLLLEAAILFLFVTIF